jgi:hypothetical protein
MKQQELTLIGGRQSEGPSLWERSDVSAWEGNVVYREMADVPVQIVDPLDELARSVSQLEDMQARLRFMMREIRTAMKI